MSDIKDHVIYIKRVIINNRLIVLIDQLRSIHAELKSYDPELAGETQLGIYLLEDIQEINTHKRLH